jgi:hypothetical protein
MRFTTYVALVVLSIVVVSPRVSAQDPCAPWESVPTPAPPNSTGSNLQAVTVIAENDVWAVGTWFTTVSGSFEARPLAMHWDGVAWAIVPTPNPSPYPGGGYAELWAVDAVSSNDVWAAGHQRIQAPDGYVGTHLLVMHWNGSTWSIVPAPLTTGGSGNFIDDIVAIGPDDVWFVGDWLEISPITVGLKKALAMHWNGSSFTITPTPFFNNGVGHGLVSVSALGGTDIWAVGGGHDGDYSGFSYIVHWDGSAWTLVPGPTPGIDQRLFAVEAIAPNDVWASGDYFDGSGYQVLMLHWNGSSWSQVPAPGGTRGLRGFGPNDVYASDTGIYHWDGAAWTSVETFGPGLEIVADLDGNVCADLWGAGRVWSGSTQSPFSARHLSFWSDAGPGISGTYGVPVLSGAGIPSPSAIVTLTLTYARDQSPAVLVAGTSQVNVPVVGGILIPSPDLLVTGLVTANLGFTLSTAWPPGIPAGTNFFLQVGIVDPLAVQGWSASNGLRLTAP